LGRGGGEERLNQKRKEIGGNDVYLERKGKKHKKERGIRGEKISSRFD